MIYFILPPRDTYSNIPLCKTDCIEVLQINNLVVLLTFADMLFRCHLYKDGWTIRVNLVEDGSYMLEYSYDGFNTKRRKTFSNKEELMKILKSNFEDEDLKMI